MTDQHTEETVDTTDQADQEQITNDSVVDEVVDQSSTLDEMQSMSDEDFANLTDVPTAGFLNNDRKDTADADDADVSNNAIDTTDSDDNTDDDIASEVSKQTAGQSIEEGKKRTQNNDNAASSTTNTGLDSVDRASSTVSNTDTLSVDSENSEKSKNSELPSNVADIFKPFKASGTQMQVRSTEEAIQLMQMGVNYNKKMQELNPHLRQVRTLEKAGVKPEDLNYLIDLHKKEPQAIQRLLAEANIDPMDLDTDSEAAKQYRPTNHSISDQEMQVDTVLNQLESSPHYSRTINVVGKEWDDESRSQFSKDPSMLVTLNEHMGNGIFDLVNDEVTRQRAFGNLAGMNDVTAYQQIGEKLSQQGAFDHLNTQQTNEDVQQQTATRKTVKPPSKQTASDNTSDLNARRRAASPTRAASKTTSTMPSIAEMAALSDEEFEKKYGSSLA